MKSKRSPSYTRRLLATLLALFITLALSCIAFYIFSDVVVEIYEALAHRFPESIPVYNIILEEADYYRVHAILDAIASIPTVFLAAYLSVILNSSKRHAFFNETHGLVTFREGCRYYFKNYIVTDIIAAIFITFLLVLLTHAVPVFHTVSKYSDPTENVIVTAARKLLIPFTALYSQIGFIPTYLAVCASALVGGIASIPHSVLHFRGDALAHTLE